MQKVLVDSIEKKDDKTNGKQKSDLLAIVEFLEQKHKQDKQRKGEVVRWNERHRR